MGSQVTSLIKNVFGTRHDRERRRVQPLVDTINAEYAKLQSISDEELQGQTAKFRARIKEATEDLERRIAELKERKRGASSADEREKIDDELGGADGRGGLEGEPVSYTHLRAHETGRNLV